MARNRKSDGRMHRALFAAVFVVLSPAVATAAQCDNVGADLKEPTLCSKTFAFQGQCGKPNYNYPEWDNVALAVGAWEKVPIRILSASADAVISVGHSTGWAMIFAGNSFNNDAMTPLRASVATAPNFWSSATTVVHSQKDLSPGMQFPAGQPMKQVHLDVHLECRPLGAPYFGTLTVWYAPAP